MICNIFLQQRKKYLSEFYNKTPLYSPQKTPVMRPFLLVAALFFSLIPLQAQKTIQLADIWLNNTFNHAEPPGFRYQRDGAHFTLSDGQALRQYDLRSGDETALLFDGKKTQPAGGWEEGFDDYEFNADESRLLISDRTERIYRWSTRAEYYIYTPADKSLVPLHPGAKQRYPAFSPDGKRIAYMVENDIYIRDLESGNSTRITGDGRKNAIINGASDWVYEEEFELLRAFEWSPNGRYLAWLRFDESAVPEFAMDIYNPKVAYPEIDTFKYPKVDAPNAVVSAWVYALADGKTQPIQSGADANDYLPRLAWTPEGKVCLTWMNRLQNHLKLLLADPASGICTTLYEEKNSRYIELHDVYFLKNGQGFIVQSEQDGYNHLWQYNKQGKKKKLLTKGNWDVTDFYGLDEARGILYFQAAAQSPMRREVYAQPLKGKKMRNLTLEPGFNSAQFNPTFDYFMHSISNLNAPPRFAVLDWEGQPLRVLEQNKRLQAQTTEYGLRPAQFFTFKTSENVNLNGWMIRPEGPEWVDKKLPVLMFVYGGPGSQQVLDQWKGQNYWWFQMLVQQGFVVACVDNRGTGARGEDFKKITYKQLGHYETLDQIEAAKYLGSLPFVDPARIGIFGWSYGGYMSSLCLLKGAEQFKAAIAVAPVINWKWYDSVYTERYMQSYALNPDGYDSNAPINFAKKLQGKYLLVHGLADDNVHFQHSAEMAKKLIAANKPFESMIYPNRNHGIRGGKARLHLYTLMTNFLKENL